MEILYYILNITNDIFERLVLTDDWVLNNEDEDSFNIAADE